MTSCTHANETRRRAAARHRPVLRLPAIDHRGQGERRRQRHARKSNGDDRRRAGADAPAHRGVSAAPTRQAVDPFSEEQARALAAQMGDGVTLLSSMPIKTAAAEGRASVYGFRDITKLRVSQAPATPGDASIRAGGLGIGGDQRHGDDRSRSHRDGQRPAHAAHARRSAERAVQPDRLAEPARRTGPARSDGDDATDARRHARSRCASNRWDDWCGPTARTSTARP